MDGTVIFISDLCAKLPAHHHKDIPLVPILSRFSTHHILTDSFQKIDFRQICPSLFFIQNLYAQQIGRWKQIKHTHCGIFSVHEDCSPTRRNWFILNWNHFTSLDVYQIQFCDTSILLPRHNVCFCPTYFNFHASSEARISSTLKG
jgi:hypothetical protein